MFKELRRKDRALPEAEARELIASALFGILATHGADGWPYAVPVHHVLDGDTLYFHCAKKGQKLDNLRHEPKVCFSVVTECEPLPAQFATKYSSACVFGSAEIVGREERLHALKLLVGKFSQAFADQGHAKAEAEVDHPEVVAVRIARITGKARR